MLAVHSSAPKNRLRSAISLLGGVALAFGFLTFTGAPDLAQAYEVPQGTWATPAGNSSTIGFPSGLTATVSSAGRTDVTGVSTLGAKEWTAGLYSPATMVTGDSAVAFRVNTGTCAATGTCTGLGTLTVSFNHRVRNPTFDFAGIGGTSGGTDWSALHAVLTSTTPGITLSRAAGNPQFAVASNQVTATDDRTYATCISTGSTGYAASCGSVVANGTSSTFSFDVSAIFTAMRGAGSNSSTTGDEVLLAVSVPQDFGDAPAGYDHTQAAAHIISGLYLGSNATEDNANVRNASTSPNAGAGAAADSDDAFSSLADIAAKPGSPYSLSVPISGATVSSTVCGWLDFDRNGVFNTSAASGEQACATVAAGATSATLSWTVPSAVSAGDSYARFRISATAAEVTGKPTGLATTGEVEDYPVSIAPMPTITLRKTTTAGSGGAFGFTLTNTTQTTGFVTTIAPGTPTQVDADAATAGTQPFTVAAVNTAVTIQESQLAAGWAFSTASCTSGGTPVGSLSGATMTLPASAIVPGATIVCDYTNGQPSISLTKTAGALSGTTAGSTLPYTFAVTNTGQTPLTSIAITDSKIAAVTCGATALAIGASTNCTGTYTLKQSDVDAGQVVNNASVSGTPPGGTAVVATATSTKTIASAAAISLTKTAGAQSGNSAGSTLPYTFTVTNTGNVTLADIAITDPQVSGLTCAATSLAPEASTTCSATHSLTQAEVDAGTIVNTAIVSGTPPSGPAVTDTATSTTSVSRNTSISLSKTAGTPTAMAAGETIPYSFTVTNTGNVTLSAVSIIDAQTGGVTCTATTLAPDASTDCIGTHTITQADLDAGSVTNNASVTATPPSGMSAPTDAATATSALTRTADATFDKQFSGTTGWSVDDVASYSFVVTNTGNVTLTDITITDPLTTGLTCPTTTLAPGVSTTCTAEHTLTQAEVDAGHLYNSATLSATPPSGVSAVSVTDDLDTPITAGPSLTLAKSASAPSVAAKDGVIGYSFLVTNTGNVTLTDVNITDAHASNLTCPQTTLAPQANITCTGEHVLTQGEVDSGSVTNTATVDALSPTGIHTSATDSVTSIITRISSLLLDKQAGTPTGSVPGATIPYTFAVKNTGNVTVSGVTVADSQLTSLTCPTNSLAPGATMNCTGAYTLTQSDVDTGGVPNTATATATPPSGVTPPTSNTDDTVTSIDRHAALDFAKTAAPPTGNREGDTITYTFTVTNNGNVTLTEVGITDPQVGPVTCPSNTLAPTASMTCTTVYPITQADVDAGGVHNVATATGTGPSGVDSPSVDANADTALTRTPSLTLVKQTNGTVPTSAGADISYEFLVTNTGNVTLTDVSVIDAKVGAVTCPTGDLAPGDTATCTASYPLLQSDVDAGSVENSATASATPPSGVTTTPTAGDTVTTTIPASPSIDLVKSAGAVVDANSSARDDAGDTITYTFTVTNTGNVTVNDVGIDDPKIGAVTCPETALAPGAQTICTQEYTLLQSDIDAGTVVNNATASGTAPTGATVTDAATTTSTLTRSASLAFDKQAGTPSGGQAGSTIAYTFVLANTGNVTLTEVGVTDTKIGTVACPVATLAPGASTTCTKLYTITQADMDTGSVANTATGHGTAPTGVTSPNLADTTTTPLTQNPTISVDKQSGGVVDANGNGTVDAGDTITYTFEVTNTGTVTLTDISVSDPLITTVTCPAETLIPAAKTTCTGSHVLSQAEVDSGAVLNTATVHGNSPQGTEISEDSNQVTTGIPANPGLSIDKSAGAPSGNSADDTIVYSFTVTNTGNVTISGIGINDPQIADITCADTTAAPGVATTCTGVYTLTQADVDHGTVTNTATVAGTSPSGDPVSAVSNTVITDIVATPGIDLVKTGSASGERAGDTVNYSFAVTNTGNVTLTNVAISDPLISLISCPQTELAPKSEIVCTGSYSLTQADVDAGIVHNDAEVSADTPHSGPVTSADGTDVAITAGPALDLVKQAGTVVDVDGNGVDAGDVLPYTFTVTNIGNVTMSSVAIQDPKISKVSCPTGSLAPGEELSCTGDYTLSQADIDTGSVTNSAKATAVGSNPDAELPLQPVATGDSVVTPIDQHPALSLIKKSDAKGTLTANSTVVFTFLVTNTGNVVLNDVTVSDPMLKSVSCPVKTLKPGQSTLCTGSPYTVTAQDAAQGKVVNTAVASTGFCPAAGCTTVSAQSTVRLAVAKNTRLAYTGAEVTPSLMLAGGVLLVGMVLVFVSRRRRHND